MKKGKGLTLLEVLVALAIISMLLAFFMPALGKVKKIASRVVCSTNLKGLGTSFVVYANDYDDKFPRLGKGHWAKELGFSYENASYSAPQHTGSSTITSSLYLLVREADVSPKSFKCPRSNQTEFDGQNSKYLDIVELWDFGINPYKHVSYVTHNPYGQYSTGGWLPASFAIAADMSPWFKNGDILSSNGNKLPPQIIDASNTETSRKGNSLNHSKYESKFLFFRYTKRASTGFGQNVLYADGHTYFEKQPNVGVNNDNIYTFWSTEDSPTGQDIQGGTAPTSRSPENDAKSEEDSFLAI